MYIRYRAFLPVRWNERLKRGIIHLKAMDPAVPVQFAAFEFQAGSTSETFPHKGRADVVVIHTPTFNIEEQKKRLARLNSCELREIHIGLGRF